MNPLVLKHRPMVYAMASRMLTPSDTRFYDDIVQAGMVALWKCAEAYDPDRGVYFPTFAKHRVRGAMIDELRKVLPGGRTQKRPTVCSIDAIPESGEDIEDTDDTIIRLDTADANKRLLEPALDALPLHLRFVIDDYFYGGKTLQEVGDSLGVSDSRVCQLKQEALAFLREHLAV